MTQRTDECKATHDELCNQMQKHYDSLSAYGCEFHSGIPRAIEFYRQHAERSLPTTSGDKELKVFTVPEAIQLLGYCEERQRQGYYYGNKKHYDKRHESIVSKLMKIANTQPPITK